MAIQCVTFLFETQICDLAALKSTTIPWQLSFFVLPVFQRQFPNIFQSKTDAKKGEGRFCNPARTTPIKSTGLTICVLLAPTTLTPKSSQELELAHTGLGKRVVPLQEESKHQEVISYYDDDNDAVGFDILTPIFNFILIYLIQLLIRIMTS